MLFLNKYNQIITGICLYIFIYTPFSQSIKNERKQNRPPDNTFNLGNTIPEFRLKSSEGIEYDSQRFKEKDTLLLFWEMDSISSKVNLLQLNKIHNKIDPSKMEIISIYTDDTNKDISSFLTKYKITVPLVMDKHLAKTIGILQFPTGIIIDKEKKIISIIDSSGLRSYEQLTISPRWQRK
jgi:peroxiredoxin